VPGRVYCVRINEGEYSGEISAGRDF
jgi:hypothetical protein